jgi:radical SAM protein with 4Fe4S-binding SPASM domain
MAWNHGKTRINRDRREATFARSVIGLAEQRRQANIQDAREAVKEAECEHCGRATCTGDCPQYYENLRDQMEDGDIDR